MQLASTILLARILSPHDFGLVAMVIALVGFAPMLIDLGTSEASTQKTHITQADISALFWLNIAVAVVLTVLLAAGSSAVAAFFGEPSLTGIALALSSTFLLTALFTQHYALMRRAMQFRHIAMIDISANLIGSAVSVAMALTGWGYWSLVAKPIVTAALTVVFVWMSCHWVPGRPRFSSDVKELVGFGLGVTGFTMTDYLAKSADRIAIGYFLGAGPLGYFQNAFTIYSNVLSILTEPVHNIAASSLSKLRNNIDELKRSWKMALSTLSFFSAPAFAVLAVTGQDFVVLLLGQKWAPAGPLLCIFAVRGIAHSVERTMGWMHVAAGRADRWMWWGVYSAVFQLLALAAGLPFGVTGVAIAYTIAMFALVRSGAGLFRTPGRHRHQGCVAGRRSADDRGAGRRCGRLCGATGISSASLLPVHARFRIRHGLPCGLFRHRGRYLPGHRSAATCVFRAARLSRHSFTRQYLIREWAFR